MVLAIIALLFGAPWWILTASGQAWPPAAVAIAIVLFAGTAVAFPFLMFRGHGRSHDAAAITGDTILGVIWTLFTWSILGTVLRVVLLAVGLDDRRAARIVTAAVLVVSLALLAWGYVEARRVPRVKRVDIDIAGLGSGLDGLRIVLLTDTHYGPINRARWSARVGDVVNRLDADIVCHTGDIADGTVDQRRRAGRAAGDDPGEAGTGLRHRQP